MGFAEHQPTTSRRGGWLRPREADLPPAGDTPGSGLTVGVLALQGAFHEHAVALRRLGTTVVEVRRPHDLENVDALVMPGGESTTMSKLLESSGLFDPLWQRIQTGLPIFGTCAGMILLATEVLDGRPDQRGFPVLDIKIRRNGYGRQVDSFETDLTVSDLPVRAGGEGVLGGGPFHAVFIRAPRIIAAGASVRVLASYGGDPVLVARRDRPIMAAAFHPELTADLRLHRVFLELVAATRSLIPANPSVGGVP